MRLFSILSAVASFLPVFALAQTFVSTAPANRNVLLEELTGVNCQFCPDGHLRAQNLKNARPGRIVLVNVHAGGYATPGTGDLDFRTTAGTAIDTYLDPDGYPAGGVSRLKNGIYGFTGFFADADAAMIACGRGYWTRRADSLLNKVSPVNVAARCTINLDTRQLRMTVEAYYTGNGNGTTDRFNAFILQNNIAGSQTGASANPNAVLPNGDYNHQHALRYNLTSSNFGDIITATTASSFYTQTYTHTIPANYGTIPVVLADLEVPVFVADSLGNVYTANYAEIFYETSTALASRPLSASIVADLGSVCGTAVAPSIAMTNMGSTPISNIQIQYSLNGTPQTYTHTLTTPAATGSNFNVSIPNVAISTGANAMTFNVIQINGTAITSTYPSVSATVSSAQMLTNTSNNAAIRIQLDAYADESSYEVVNETTGATVLSGVFTTTDNSQAYTYNFNLVQGNCYRVKVMDSYGDGLCTNGGSCGNFAVSIGSQSVYTNNGNFGRAGGLKFTYTQIVGVTDVTELATDLNVYPNPTRELLNVEFTLANDTETQISVLNSLGQVVKQINQGNLATGTHTIQVPTTELANGSYLLMIRQGDKIANKRFMVIK